MKKLIIISAVLFLAVPAFSQVWYPVNQATFGWDAVTKLNDGTTIPAGSTIKYQAWRKMTPATVWEKIGAEITTLQANVSFAVEGSYFLGVSAIRYIGTDPVSQSTIAGSDVPANCQGGAAFGFKYWLALMMPSGLRPITP